MHDGVEGADPTINSGGRGHDIVVCTRTVRRWLLVLDP